MARDSMWRNRIIGHGEEAPDQLLANPKNWRIHPRAQQNALQGAIDSIGFIRSVTVNQRTGFVVDGHLRVAMAISSGQKSIPVEYVDLSPEEEAQALVEIDPLTAMAIADQDQLNALLQELSTGDEAIQEVINALPTPTAAFVPNHEPRIGMTHYDADDIEKAQTTLENAFTKQRELEPVMCPHCGREFFLDK